MGGSVNPAAAQERGVGRIDDGIDILLGDVPFDDEKSLSHFMILSFKRGPNTSGRTIRGRAIQQRAENMPGCRSRPVRPTDRLPIVKVGSASNPAKAWAWVWPEVEAGSPIP